MIQWKNRMLCEYCLEECEAEQCVHCGNNSTIEHTPTGCLPPKTILKERYIIGKVLGRGGFGITYLAFDMLEDCRVAIKEYFPDNLVFRQPGDIQVHSYTNAEQADSFRSGSEKFYTEAQTMARFNGHPNIVNVQRFFYENQTAYYVMEYLDGIDLKKYLDIHGKRLSFEDTMKLLLPVMDAMTLVHSTNILHRDISPDNIFILKDGTVKLLDFGSARQVLAEQSKSLSVILKVGFAPVEQYQSHGKQGPWTDIYALAATMYYCLTGEIPVAAMDRVEEDHLKKISELCPEIGKKADKIFAKALAVRAVNRYQSMAEFRDDLMTLIVSKTALPTMPKTTSVTQMPKKFVWTKKRIIAVIAAAAVLICSSGIAYAAVKINEKKEVNREQSFNSEGLGNVTDVPTPEPTATNTPVPTPSPEPTATNTPVPTPSPKPTATSTPVPTPTRKPTNTPTPKPTATPTPTATLTSIPTSKSVESLLPTNGSQQSFYKSVAADTAVFLGVYSDATSWRGELYRYDTEMVYEIPQEMIEVGTKYTKIDNSVLLGQPEGKYHFTLYWTIESFGKVVYSSSKAWTIYIYDESTEAPKSVTPIYTNNETFVYEKPWDIKKTIDSRSTNRFSYITAEMPGMEKEYFTAKYGSILCDGKVAFIGREYLLLKFKQGETITITYYFEDGSQLKENILFAGGAATPKPTNTPTPIPTTINQYFYLSCPEDIDLIINFGMGKEAISWGGSCYNYSNGCVTEIPQEMIEMQYGTIRIKDEFLMNLEPAIYEFSLQIDTENRTVETNRTVKIEDKSIKPLSSGQCVPISRKGYTNSGDVIFIIHSQYTSRFIGVAIDGIKVEEEGYIIGFDGKLLLLHKRYMSQFTEKGSIIITYYLDNGEYYDIKLQYE